MMDRFILRFAAVLLLVITFVSGTCVNYAASPASDRELISSDGNPEILIAAVSMYSPTVKTYNSLGKSYLREPYECITLYNNSDASLDFADYSLSIYGRRNLLCDIEGSYIVPPKGVLVVWLQGTHYYDMVEPPTLQMFKDAWGITLPDEQIAVVSKNFFRFENKETTCNILLLSDNGLLISRVTVNPAKKGDPISRGCYYFKQASDNNRKLNCVDQLEDYVPGTLPVKFPDKYIASVSDVQAPQIANVIYDQNIEVGDGFSLTADITDDRSVVSAYLRYSIDGGEEKAVGLTNINWKIFKPFEKELRATIPYYELYGAQTLNFYITYTDGVNKCRYPAEGTESVSVTKSGEPLFSLVDGSYVKGTVNVIGRSGSSDTAKSILLDGKGVKTYKTLPYQPMFVFKAQDLDQYFSNSVMVNGRYVSDLANNSNKIHEFSYGIPQSVMGTGNNDMTNITIECGTSSQEGYINSVGSKDIPYDDFLVRGMRLILESGAVYRPLYVTQKYDYNKKDYTFPFVDKNHYIGDNTDSSYAYTFSSTFKFDIPDSEYTAIGYNFDTTDYKDGLYNFEYTEEDKTVADVSVTVDNTAPFYSTNLQENQVYNGSEDIRFDIDDKCSGIENIEVLLDEHEVPPEFNLSDIDLEEGEHIINIYAVDKAGNELEKSITFRLIHDEESLVLTKRSGIKDGTVTVEADEKTDKTEIYKAVRPDTGSSGYKIESGITKWHVTSNDKNYQLSKLFTEDGGAEDYKKLLKTDGSVFESSSAEGIPYQAYTISVGKKEAHQNRLLLKWNGNSIEGGSVEFFVKNVVTGCWDYKAQRSGPYTGEITLPLDTDTYLDDENRVEIILQGGLADKTNDYDYSIRRTGSPGSFTFGWITDTQNIAEGQAPIYHQLTQWLSDAYVRGDLWYGIHSGDIINYTYFEKWWNNADAAMKRIESVDMPFGILAGNHDVNHSDTDTALYSKYFGAWRYQDKPWYGESYKDNFMHYDLISPQGRDMIVLYVSYVPKLTNEMKEWIANKLTRFADRDAIIVTHDYMSGTGERTVTGQELYEKIVTRHKNVKLILNGHAKGEFRRTVEIKHSDGTVNNVVEMMYDFQFDEKDLMGYTRLLSFDGSALSVKTYSTVDGSYLSDGNNEFKVNLKLNPSYRMIATDMLSIVLLSDEEIQPETIEKTSKNTVEITFDEDTLDMLKEGTDGETGVVIYTEQFDGGKRYSDFLGIADDFAPVISNAKYGVVQYGKKFDPIKNVSAEDEEDGDITDSIIYKNEVNTDLVGSQYVKYSIKDSFGNVTEYMRKIRVVDKTAPVINIPNDIQVGMSNQANILEGITAVDEYDGDLTAEVRVAGDFSMDIKGTFLIKYEVADYSGNMAYAYRKIDVLDDVPPVIEGVRNRRILHKKKVDLTKGLKASDNVDGDLTDSVVITGKVNNKKLGMYNILYRVEDSSGNVTEVPAVYTIADKTKPVLTVKSFTPRARKKVNLLSKASWKDNCDGSGKSGIRIYIAKKRVKKPKKYKFKKPGKYTLVYEKTDKSGNIGTKQVKITVKKAPKKAAKKGGKKNS